MTKKDILLSDLKQAKRVLEEEILVAVTAAVYRFEVRTGTQPENIDIHIIEVQRMGMPTNHVPHAVHATVKVF